jgi:chloramphenicol 3-O phosphotransferase
VHPFARFYESGKRILRASCIVARMSAASDGTSNEMGTVIVLNGPSVAGKSSIQRALQAHYREPHLAMGLDSLVCAPMPQRYFSAPPPPDREQVMWGDATTDTTGAPLFPLHFGPFGRRAVSGMHRAIAGYAQAGNRVIVDYIAYEPDFLVELAHLLAPVTAWLIGVHTALDVLEAREQERATSPRGHARSHYHTVHAHGVYDFEVDTAQATADTCAAAIAEHLARTPTPTAFETLRRRGKIVP